MRNNLNYWCVVVINCLFGNILCFSDPYGQEFFTKLLNEGQVNINIYIYIYNIYR